MTEREWLDGTVNWRLLEHLGDRPGGRKYRLLAAACVRRLRAAFPAEVAPVAETVEGYADGERTKKALQAVRAAAGKMRYGPTLHGRQVGSALYAATWINPTPTKPLWERVSHAIESAAHAVKPLGDGDGSEVQLERTYHRSLIRCIFGNPFRPVTLDPAWLTSDVLAIARGVYDERAFDRLPILADALQDAGCDHPDILAHCRGPGPHARGCWVVDLLLGKQ